MSNSILFFHDFFILGYWHYSAADVPGYQRWTATAIFGSPPSSTFEEALRHFQRAEAIQPGFYSQNALYMGLCMERLNRDRNEAQEWFKKAFMAPMLSKDDAETHKIAAEHLCKKYGFNQEMLQNLLHGK
jgi:hypothetical protein